MNATTAGPHVSHVGVSMSVEVPVLGGVAGFRLKPFAERPVSCGPHDTAALPHELPVTPLTDPVPVSPYPCDTVRLILERPRHAPTRPFSGSIRMRARAMNALGAVAVPAEKLEPFVPYETVSSMPTDSLRREAVGRAVFGPIVVHVVERQEHWLRLAATCTGAAVQFNDARLVGGVLLCAPRDNFGTLRTIAPGLKVACILLRVSEPSGGPLYGTLLACRGVPVLLRLIAVVFATWLDCLALRAWLTISAVDAPHRTVRLCRSNPSSVMSKTRRPGSESSPAIFLNQSEPLSSVGHCNHTRDFPVYGLRPVGMTMREW